MMRPLGRLRFAPAAVVYRAISAPIFAIVHAALLLGGINLSNLASE